MSGEQNDKLRRLDVKLVWVILLTLTSAASTSAVGLYRIGVLEKIIENHAEQLRVPRYTVKEDDVRRSADRRELMLWQEQIERDHARRERWIETMNAAMLANAEFIAETRSAVREIREDLKDLKIKK